MYLKTILTDRHYIKWPSYHIIFEWEDEIAKSLGISLINSPVRNNIVFKKLMSYGIKFFNNDFTVLTNQKKEKNGFSLYFEMSPKFYKTFSNQERVVPIIIDFWGKDSLKSFYNYYKNCPFILISSIEVFEYLKKNKTPLNIYHFPLSLPDKYKLDEKRTNNKKYDIVLAGRINPILWKYLKEFEKSHPNIEYLFQEKINGELFYRSNKRGIIGKYQSRNSYFELIKSARICFYASPGIDIGEFRTGGFNPITPRFLEFLSAGCHVIARYPLNEESCFYQMESICPPINTYNEFKEQLSRALSAKDQPIQRNSSYLSNHYTSKRVPLLIDILSNSL